MLPKDRFARSIEHPKDFSSDTIDQEQYFQLGEKPNGVYVLSVSSRFILREDEKIHDYGRKVVAMKNERFAKEKGHDPSPLKKYIGFYEIFEECANACTDNNYNAVIRWVPENGLDAHFEVQLLPIGDGSAKQRKKSRRRARQILFDNKFGPEICRIAALDGDLKDAISNLTHTLPPANPVIGVS
ncbi:hypothetical protein [uncultured Salipiger sp.]|uniref:hypothetical protein n=1 Tax=uncultured Salipiger sp. TaxID=499810 RepID=UPI00259A8257|nr:hypothetical protein [uncultured Salipiger sp.]